MPLPLQAEHGGAPGGRACGVPAVPGHAGAADGAQHVPPPTAGVRRLPAAACPAEAAHPGPLSQVPPPHGHAPVLRPPLLQSDVSS